MEKNLEKIKGTIEEILGIMGFSASVQVFLDSQDSITANILTDEGGFLIGQSGENLLALQHIIRLIIFKEKSEEKMELTGEPKKSPAFFLDVNGYRKEKVEILRELALDRADQVARERRIFSFRPMSSYERRIVHMALGNRRDVVCESEGEGSDRHVVIRPA